MCIADIVGVLNEGFGTHVSSYKSLEQFLLLLKATYAFQIAYCIAITLPKFSVLALYWRVFGLESFRWPLLATGIMTGMYGIAVVSRMQVGASQFADLVQTLVAIFSCVPVEGFWDRTIPSTCINSLSFYIGQAVATITIDIILLLLPILPIRRLHISTSQKVAVVGIFGLGIL